MFRLFPVSLPNLHFQELQDQGGIRSLPFDLQTHWLTNTSINAGHTEIARSHGCASEKQTFGWAQMLMAIQTTERNEAKRRESKGFFSK